MDCLAGQFTQQCLCASSTLLEIPQPGSILAQSAERVSQMLCNHGELYPWCSAVGTGGQQTFLCIGVFIESPDRCSVITYSYTFPPLEMDVYIQKIPTHYGRTALPPGVHAHKPTVVSVCALARDGNLSRECNYAIGKC